MELSDSTGGDRNLNAPPHHHQDARSGLGIDLNEIPSPSSSFAETLPDSAVDIVRAYHENPAPPPGGPAALPRGPAPRAACAKPAAWVCGECVAAGVKSKRWPLGVKSKQLLDINAPPPSDVDGDGDEVQELRKHTLGDNPFGAPVTYSNLYNGNAIGFQKASGVVTHAVRVGFEDILNHTQSITRSFEELSPNEIFLQALRDFISERRGVLEEGWRVEFRQSVSSSELYAVYCAPDGKIFDSVYEVACYLGLSSGNNSIESELRNERSLPSLGGPLSRKRKSTRTPVANGFVEKRGATMNSNCKDPPSDGLNVECASAQGNIPKSSETGRKEDGHSCTKQSSDGLPLQFKDFFVLSLGKVDVRPSYYDVNLICPVGYKSCWHDKITGSLFTCEVLEGGDSGPIFRIQRCSCSKIPVPVGSTILSMSKLCQFVSQTTEGGRKTNGSMDIDDDESIQMMLIDPCVPTGNDVASCFASFSIEDPLSSDVLHPVAGSVQDNTRNSLADNLGFNDGIGELLVEERAWELLERFHEILDLKEPLSLDELEKELMNPWFDGLDFLEKSERDMDECQVLISQEADGNCRPLLSPRCEAGPSGSFESSHAFIQLETEAIKEAAQVKLASFTYDRCFGVVLTKAHDSLLRVLIGELLSRVAALVDPNSEPGETRTRRGRRKDMDSAVPAKRTKLNMLPINELTWPELAHRYILAFLSMDGNLESAEITARESGKVFRCLRGDGGLLCGSLTGVAGMEADALLLAEATKKIFGSLSRENDVLTMEEEESDAKGTSENILANDGSVPEWAQMLEPVRKLPTNVGTRIRKCVYDALGKDPPEWAKKILERSISKEVYKGNASGPTKKAVLSVLANVVGEGLQSNPSKGQKKKIVISVSDIIMKQCRIVLRRAAAADDSKVFCNLLGRKLINSSDNDDEGLLGSPAMVSRPLDFRTIDLRLAAGAYGGSHEAFLEDVRELWNNVHVAFGDQPDLVELAEKLSQNFESLYNEEVVTYVQKFVEYAKLECLSAEMRKEVDDFIETTNEIPKAPWDEGVCKVCGIDRDDDSVLLCDTCDAEYHTYCLNPPLARIPEGNWYCPSCVDGKHATQDVTEVTQIKGKRRSKKFQGEVNSLYLESLTQLSTVIEEKEYWEYSMGERTFLLKFLCDELLNSSLIRQHLEQCSELSAELHQKLRAHSVEWKSLKTREDILSAKAAKIDTYSLNTAGEVGLKEGIASLLSSSGKCLVHVDKSISVTNSDSDSQNMNSIDVEGQFRNVSGAVESQCTDKSPKSLSSPNHMSQEINGAAHVQANHQKCEGRDISTPVTCQQGGVPVDVPQITVNESEPYQLELNAIRRDISLLQDSITSVVSQLLKLSVRREFLGIDSIGRLYWASALPRGRSRIVVDASAALLHGRGTSFSRDYVENSPWIAYETDAEIEELLGWLDDSDPKERELKDSIIQGPKSRFQEFLNAQTENQVEDQGPISMPRKREKTVSNSLVTKATALLEKKFEKNKDKSGSSKGRGNLKCDISNENSRADAETAATRVSGCSKLSSRLIKFSNEESTCPFSFEDICSKFVTNDSNKELVREIGLIGSDGIPSFVPSVSSFVSDSTLFLVQKDDSIVGGVSKVSESQVSQGNTDGVGTCLDHRSGISTGRLAANESNKSNKSSLGEQRDGKFSFCSPASDTGVDGCCVVPLSSLRPLDGKAFHILRQLKINLLDMDAALPEIALRPSKAPSDRRQAWRAFVKSAETIYEMIQATITLEDMIKTEYLRNDWWYWSSFSAAAKSSTLPSLALRIYSLDLAIIYEKMPNSNVTDNSEPCAIVEQKSPMTVDAEKSKPCRKSNRKRKELDG
uniref:Lysine-specific demethylase 5B-B n=1 Tax=Cajanus cajan TaxID=3821 RepID=A0A151S6Z5_CAJCA|nr:Lysine-specific demethylase 5B-B [Cajanus cajan]